MTPTDQDVSARERLYGRYIRPLNLTEAHDCRELLDAIEREAVAAALARVRAAVSARYDDLRWCNKKDNCHDLAEGVELALSDVDYEIAAIEGAR